MGRRGKTEKMSVTLPRELAAEIRSIVSQGEVSSFFNGALTHYPAYRKQKIALGKGFGAWKGKNHPDLKAPEDSTAYVHNIRETDEKRLESVGHVGAK
jgi:hypothetical protein